MELVHEAEEVASRRRSLLTDAHAVDERESLEVHAINSRRNHRWRVIIPASGRGKVASNAGLLSGHVDVTQSVPRHPLRGIGADLG